MSSFSTVTKNERKCSLDKCQNFEILNADLYFYKKLDVDLTQLFLSGLQNEAINTRKC